nr:alpha-ketoglutarate-dependent dioxygenase AlkB [Pseudoalteromonas caenipelagi]
MPLSRDAHYYSQFVSDELSQSLFDWLMNSFDLSTPETIELPDGTKRSILPWRMMFLEPNLANSGQFPVHHGRCSVSCDLLEQLRQQIIQITGVNLQVAVCLYYPNGKHNLGFHSDLPAFGSTDTIASISLGAEREFLIRSQHDHNEQYSITLKHGSLLVMGKGFQDVYEHAITEGECDSGVRFNISFRRFGDIRTQAA